MAADFDAGIAVAAAITAVPATIAAIASLRSVRVGRNAREEAKATRDEFRQAIDDGNGGKKLGIAVHDLGKTTEYLAAQLHEMHHKIDSHAEKLDEHIIESHELKQKYLPLLTKLATRKSK